MFETGKKEEQTEVQTRTPLKALLEVECVLPMPKIYNSNSIPFYPENTVNESTTPLHSTLTDAEEQNIDSEPMEATNSFIVSQEDDIPVAEANNIVALPIDTLTTSKERKKTVVSLEENERQAITNRVNNKIRLVSLPFMEATWDHDVPGEVGKRSRASPYSTFLPSDVRIMAEHPLDIYVLNG
ncbi:hypothetical protein OUZ56_010530 [Daphnia magna]|uniref:Uncharacterized protein n=1 Tax=Daphnia magna TaxID=35525 RepID=A0ABR0AIS0_9CRUS|nr:hypothetical protein OUZ56_010530 [Daphnia magna]